MRPPSIAYPSVQEYCDALQHPKKCFRVAELQGCDLETDARKLPMPRTGAAAAVFKLTPSSGLPFALKVFKFPLAQRQQRYKAISDYLETFRSRYLVEFSYEDEGIRVPRGAETFGQALWFPTLRMSWVSGLTLNRWMHRKVQAREARTLRAFAGRFEEMIGELKSRSVAHGDLQHGNVMVVNDEPVLVDYDGTYVPSLADSPPEEYGLPGCQHPLRQKQKWWHADLDDFAAWVIWLALRAIAADMSLWGRHNLLESESFLFAPQDLTDPQQSKIWTDLLRSPDREVIDQASRLLDSLRPPFLVPPFSHATSDPLAQLRELCGASPKDYEAIDRAASELKAAGVVLAGDLLKEAEDACLLVQLRTQIRSRSGGMDWPAIDATARKLNARGVALSADEQKWANAARKVIIEAPLRTLCRAEPKDHDAIARVAEEVIGQLGPLPMSLDLQQHVEGARKFAAVRKACQERDLDALDRAVAELAGAALPAGLEAEIARARQVVALAKLCATPPTERDHNAIDREADRLRRGGVTLPADLQREVDAARAVVRGMSHLRWLCSMAVKDYDAIERITDELTSAGLTLPPELQREADNARQVVALRGLCAATPKDYDAIDRLVNELSRLGVVLPADLEREMDLARSVARLRVTCATGRDHDAIDREAERLKQAGVTLPADLQRAVDLARGVIRLREQCSAAEKDYLVIDRQAGMLVRAGVTLPGDLQREADNARQVVALRGLCAASAKDHPAIDRLAGELNRLGVALPRDLLGDVEVARQVTALIGLTEASVKDHESIDRLARDLNRRGVAVPAGVQGEADSAALVVAFAALCSAPSKDYSVIDRDAGELKRRGVSLSGELQRVADDAAQVVAFGALCRAQALDHAAIDRAAGELKGRGVSLPTELQREADEASDVVRLRGLCFASGAAKDWAAIERDLDGLKRRGIALPPDLEREAELARWVSELRELCSATDTDKDWLAIDRRAGELKRAGVTLTDVSGEVDRARLVGLVGDLCSATERDHEAIDRAAAEVGLAGLVLPAELREEAENARQVLLVRSLCSASPQDHDAIDREAKKLTGPLPAELQAQIDRARQVIRLGELASEPARDHEAIARLAADLHRGGVTLPAELQRAAIQARAILHLRELCKATPRNHELIARLAAAQTNAGVTLPPDLRRVADDAALVVALGALCRAQTLDQAAIDRATSDLQARGVALSAELRAEVDQARRVLHLRSLCAEASKDWDAIDGVAGELKRRGVTLPRDLQREADGARRLLDERDRLIKAVASCDPALVAAALPTDLDRIWPACAGLAGRARALGELEAALAPGADRKAFQALWRRLAPQLADEPAAARYAFLALVADPPSEQAIVGAFEKLGPAGQQAIPEEARARVQLAEERLRLLGQLAAIPRVPTEDNDRAIVRLYNPAVLADCPEAAEFQGLRLLATQRVVALERLAALLRQGRGATKPEDFFEQVREVAKPLPLNYPHSQKKEVEQALEWLRVSDQLNGAIASKDWESVASLSRHVIFNRLPLPAGCADEVDRARRRADARLQLQTALASGSLERIAALHPDSLDEWPQYANLIARARRAKELLGPLRELKQAAASPGDGRRLVQLWQQYEDQLNGWAEGPPLAEAAAAWREKLQRRDAFERLLKAPRTESPALCRAWKALQEVGGHPDAQAWAPQAAQAEARTTRIDALRRVPRELSEKADREFAAAWDDELLHDHWEGEVFLPRLHVVRERLALVDSLLHALGRGDDVLAVRVADQIAVNYRLEDPTPERVAQARRRIEVFAQIRRAADQKRWREVAALASRAVLDGTPRPDDVEAAIATARERLDARARWEEALTSRSLERVAAMGNLDLLDDWPEVAQQARQAKQLVALWRQLQQAAANTGDTRPLVELWSVHGARLSGWDEAEKIGRQAEACEARYYALVEIKRLAQADRVTARQFLAAWQLLLASGGPPEERELIELAELMRKRAASLDALAAVPDELSEAADRQFEAAWGRADLGTWWEAEPFRKRMAAVRIRLDVLAELADAVRRGDDPSIDHLGAALRTQGYVLTEQLSRQIDGTRQRTRLRRALRGVLAEQPPSDLKIAAAYEAFTASGQTLRNPDDVERVTLALRRRDALLALSRIHPAVPMDRQDEEWKTQWERGDLEDCNDLTPEQRTRHVLAVERSTRAARLLKAVAEGDLNTVLALADDPQLTDHPRVEGVRDRLGDLLRQGESVRAVLDVLRAVRDGTLSDDWFADVDLDLSCVESNVRTFREFKEEFRFLLRRELDRARPRWVGQLALLDEGATKKLQARWECKWRTFGLGEWTCKLAISTEPIPDDPVDARAIDLNQTAYDARNGRHRAPAQATQVFVTVWPTLALYALGIEVIGDPLVAGPVGTPRKRTGWLWG